MSLWRSAAKKRALKFSKNPQRSKQILQNSWLLSGFPSSLPPPLSWSPCLSLSVGKPHGAADARAAVLWLLALAFLMEMAMAVWLNNSDGLCVHACIMERQACESERVDAWCMVSLVWVEALSELMYKQALFLKLRVPAKANTTVSLRPWNAVK